MTITVRQGARPAFFSLRWKILLVFAGVMFANFFALYLLTTHSYQRSYDTSMQRRHALHGRLLGELLFKKQNYLVDAQQLVALTLQKVAASADYDALWEVISTYDQVQELAIFSSQKTLITAYYQSSLLPTTHAPDAVYFARTQQYQSPESFYQCATNCVLTSFNYYPVDGQGYYVLLSSRLTDLVRDFDELSHAKLAVLSTQPLSAQPFFWLPVLEKQLAAASNPIDTIQLLQQLTPLEVGASRLLHHDNKVWDVQSIPASTAELETIVFSNITQEYQQLMRHKSDLALVSLAVSCLFMLLLSSVVSRPLQRLRALSQSLPELVVGNYQRLRQVAKRPLTAGTADELSMIYQNTVTVSHQLERLNRERLDAITRLEYSASHDALTDVLTRRKFSQLATVLINQQTPFGLIFIDLNDFKGINDHLGHRAGDEFLQHVVAELRQHLAPEALISRLGGDEFAIIDAITPFETLAQQVQRVSDKLADYLPLAMRPLRISRMAAGYAHFPRDQSSLNALLHVADRAMYKAKLQDSRQLCRYEPELEQALFTQTDKRNFIQALINNDQLAIYWQPIIRLSDGRVFAYECLSRPHYRHGQLIKPNIQTIIHYAEECGIVAILDRHITQKIIEQLETKQLADHLSACINLSALSLTDPQFTDALAAYLDQHASIARQVIFEVTETAQIQDLSVVEQVMLRLKSKGVRFALDDFGDGFASFSYLKTLPFDIVKIDGSFIRNLASSRKDNVLVDAMVATVRTFGMQLIAEYVENDTILAILQQKGIQYGQGFYFAAAQAQPVDGARMYRVG